MATRIWTIPSATLFAFTGGRWQGLRLDPDGSILQLLREKGEFLTRTDELEHDPTHQQVVARVILRVGDKFAFHEVPPRKGENRLEGMWVVGAQGHAEEVDLASGNDIAAVACEREFREEYGYDGQILSKKYLGIICVEVDASIPGADINAVHIGLVYEFVGDTEEVVSIDEEEIVNLHFASIPEIEDVETTRLEFWTQFLLPVIRELAAAA